MQGEEETAQELFCAPEKTVSFPAGSGGSLYGNCLYGHGFVRRKDKYSNFVL